MGGGRGRDPAVLVLILVFVVGKRLQRPMQPVALDGQREQKKARPFRSGESFAEGVSLALFWLSWLAGPSVESIGSA